ncbi:hypothetical protein evm_007898 [Chilo suppressalis]|nr:hypothetical protein evm_007898 [Chilo suppressalis]
MGTIIKRRRTQLRREFTIVLKFFEEALALPEQGYNIEATFIAVRDAAERLQDVEEQFSKAFYKSEQYDEKAVQDDQDQALVYRMKWAEVRAKFPANETIRAKWIKIIRQARLDEIWNPAKSSVICSKHFEDDCFYDTKCGLKKIRKGSVPNKHMAIISEEDETLMDTSITGPLTIMDDMAMVTEEPAHENVGAVSAGPSTLMNTTKLTSSLSLPDLQIGDVPVSDLNSIFDTPRKMKLRALYRREPGFSDESFEALKEKAKTSEHKIICALIADEMSIRRQSLWDGKKKYGYIDMGTSSSECQTLASEAVLKTTFKHPADDSDVAIFLDPVHMIKLVRNHFESKKTFLDENEEEINWHLICELNKLQENEGLHIANKLTRRHIMFRNNIMKVKLASQVLSNSVATALKFCREDAKLYAFKNSKPTETFVKNMNDLFDIFNSRNMKIFDYKQALNSHNKDMIFNFLDKMKTYISKLKMWLREKLTKMEEKCR